MNGGYATGGWHYSKAGTPAGQQVGPVSPEQLGSFARAGTVAPDDLVWNPSSPVASRLRGARALSGDRLCRRLRSRLPDGRNGLVSASPYLQGSSTVARVSRGDVM